MLKHVSLGPLAKAVGVPSSLPVPLLWSRANATDMAIISGYIPLIREANPFKYPPSKLAVASAVRFAYTHVLQYFLVRHPALFKSLFHEDNVIPNKASRYGRTCVLNWWKRAYEQYPEIALPPTTQVIEEAVDSASRGGQVYLIDYPFEMFILI